MSKNQISALCSIAEKSERYIIGLMSGTSLDGLDVAICNIKGCGINTSVSVLHFETVYYEISLKNEILKIFAKKEIDFFQLCQMNALLGNFYADKILHVLKSQNINPETIDLIASHGQTVLHIPQKTKLYYHPSTLQIGDGDHIARRTGIITFSDFRQKHIAAGGEGAPLALYGDVLLFSDVEKNRFLLNLGGIANFTFLPAQKSAHHIFTTDTGPANTLIDQYCLKHLLLPFDKNGEIAETGKVIPELLKRLKTHPFFDIRASKSTGQETFHLNFVEESLTAVLISDCRHEDVVTTLTQLTADTISDSISRFSDENEIKTELYISGGGLHNKSLMKRISLNLPNMAINPFENFGILPDAKEAVLFAVLANEAIAGDYSTLAYKFPNNMPKTSFGKISLP